MCVRVCVWVEECVCVCVCGGGGEGGGWVTEVRLREGVAEMGGGGVINRLF